MKKKNGTKIMAFLALFGIIIGIIGTGILIIFDKPTSEQTLTQEQYDELLKQINSSSGIINSGTGVNLSTGTLIGTGETN